MTLIKSSLKFWWIALRMAIENSLVVRHDLRLMCFDVFDRNLDLTCGKFKKVRDITRLPAMLVIVQNIENSDSRALNSGRISSFDDLWFWHDSFPRW